MQIFPITELAYFSNSCTYFEKIRDQPHPIFLDSCQPYFQNGHHDILSAAPYTYLTTYQQQTTITNQNDTIQSERDPFILLKEELAKHQASTSHLPFNGGALGFFAYDLNKRLEKLTDKAIHDIHLPDMAVGIYLWAIIVDHKLKKTYLLHPPEDKAPECWEKIKSELCHPTLETYHPALETCHPALVAGSGEKLNINQTPQQVRGDRFQVRDDRLQVQGDRLQVQSDRLQVQSDRLQVQSDRIIPKSNLNKAEYLEQFKKIMHHIEQGDTYQINFAQRWQVPYQGDSWELYQLLREKNPAPFAAYIPLENGAILSCSPERFLTVNNKAVITMPIKGTAKREKDPVLDQKAATDLLASEKNRAENIMIVDLMRNDLGKDCITGSVNVPKLCELQSFTNVHHLVSTVCGELRADKQCLDVLRDCFPGGSITGAPKISAMNIIDDCEPHRRHIYCGSIGYVDFNGHMDTNIAIRTMVMANDELYFWGGGGIVKDSDPDLEYQETIDKVQPFLDILL